MLDFMVIILKKGLKSAKMNDALYNLPKTIAKVRNLPLPPIENIEVVPDNFKEKE